MNMKYQKGEFITIPNKSALRGLSPNLQVLFLWLCDHSDDNNQSFPSRKVLAVECGMSIDTLDRGMQKLVQLGMVQKTKRYNSSEQTTNLYEILILAAESDTLAADSRGVAAESGQVAAKTTLGGRKNRTQNSTHLTQPIKLNSTNVLEAVASPVYGNSDVNDLFSYWLSVTGLPIQSKVKLQRQACSSLIKQWQVEGVKRLVDGVVLSLGDQYAPRIGSFIDLRNKQNDLLIWGRKKELKATGRKTIKI